jgi:hypothetical protein
MSKQLVLLSIRADQLNQLGEIADVNDASSVAAELWRAHDRYLDAQWKDRHDELLSWSERMSVQINELIRRSPLEVEGKSQHAPRPETPDIKLTAIRSDVGCQYTRVNMSDDQVRRFALLCAFYGKTIDALAEDAYAIHIQAEMLDDPADFENRRKQTEQERKVVVEKLLANNLRIA